ncbi:ankyrin repeat and LEM domain-containing protein 2-like [Tropilaelaps mercedesae]|uniref:Ankyrin repeat and LEM domain-containing protein 2-like n=1 Tax=Tropilaelaps mercedesae TaxID=418985 RepID=A0A1V9XNF1_9ACAR|nr:ankyrin repeat and LEM domain-containing protein 2-like [Tropilaelaps mercedesae]
MPLYYMFPLFERFVNSVTGIILRSASLPHCDVAPRSDDSLTEDEEFIDAADVGPCDKPVVETRKTQKQQHLFAVALPASQESPCRDASSLVLFQDFHDVLEFCKQNKAASPRWKQVADAKEAENFSSHLADAAGSDPNDNSEQMRDNRESIGWRMPASQDTVKLRKSIESGSVEDVRAIIASNPRYLIGSGDTPTVLQEGCRYNACHIAAKADRADMLTLVLDTLRSKSFFKKMYPDDTEATTESRMAFLIDLYLNMPDKTRKSETPLHFACKFGALACVQVLLDQPECDPSVTNGEGLRAQNIICERVSGQPVLTRKIRALFEECFFIPILRDENGDCLARVGTPVISKQLHVMLSPQRVSTPRSGKRLTAVVGPLTSIAASEVMADLARIRLRRWDVETRRRDAEKGLECIVRKVARQRGAPWSEYWDFIGRFVDLASSEGLAAFEGYLKGRFVASADVTFVVNQQPTKTDYHVWTALEAIRDGIDRRKLPFVGQWTANMKAFSKADMESWKTPVKCLPTTLERGAGDDVGCLVNLMSRFNANEH